MNTWYHTPVLKTDTIINIRYQTEIIILIKSWHRTKRPGNRTNYKRLILYTYLTSEKTQYHTTGLASESDFRF